MLVLGAAGVRFWSFEPGFVFVACRRMWASRPWRPRGFGHRCVRRPGGAFGRGCPTRKVNTMAITNHGRICPCTLPRPRRMIVVVFQADAVDLPTASARTLPRIAWHRGHAPGARKRTSLKSYTSARGCARLGSRRAPPARHLDQLLPTVRPCAKQIAPRVPDTGKARPWGLLLVCAPANGASGIANAKADGLISQQATLPG